MKNLLFILIVIFGSNSYIKSQSILAGSHKISDYYHDIVPDFVLNSMAQNGDGRSYSIDFNEDGINDITILGDIEGSNYRVGNIRIASAEHCKIASIRTDTVFVMDTSETCNYSHTRYYSLIQKFSYPEPINNNNSWSDYATNYVSYILVHWCYGNHSFGVSSEIIGVQLFVEADTLYGWVKLSNIILSQWDGATATIEEYACGRMPSGLNEILTFPNPCKDILTIRLPDYYNEGTFSLFDLRGRELFQKQTYSTEFKIDLAWLPSGIYVFKFLDDNHTGYGKIIKE